MSLKCIQQGWFSYLGALMLFWGTFGPESSQALPISGRVDVEHIVVSPQGETIMLPDGSFITETPPQRFEVRQIEDVGFATQIYDQIGLSFQVEDIRFLRRTDPNRDGQWSLGEFEKTLVRQSRGDPRNVHVYYVPDIVDGLAFAVTEEDVRNGKAQFPGIILEPHPKRRVRLVGRNLDTYAHEIAHILTDEFRFLPAERFRDPANNFRLDEFHTADRKNLLAAGQVRTKPGQLSDIFPFGKSDEIPNLLGTVSSDDSARVPFVNSFYNLSSFVQDVRRDDFLVTTSGDGTVFSADWGRKTFSSSSTIEKVQAVGRKVGTNTDEVSFSFGLGDLTSTLDQNQQFFNIGIADVDWVNGNFPVDIDLSSVGVKFTSESGGTIVTAQAPPCCELSSSGLVRSGPGWDFSGEVGADLGFDLNLNKNFLIRNNINSIDVGFNVTVADQLTTNLNPIDFSDPTDVLQRFRRLGIDEIELAKLNLVDTTVPEPSTIVLLGSGLLGLITWKWKQMKHYKKS